MAAGDGLVTMTPTSIVVAGAGSSASINSDGGVDFTAATSLSLNGVFTSSFDNYLLVVTMTMASGGDNINFRLRASGTDASGSNYTRQYVQANGVSVDAGRDTSQTAGKVGFVGTTLEDGIHMHIYGPFLAQPTATRSVGASSLNSAMVRDEACTHSLSTSYDGITIIPVSSSVTGNIVVFGYEE